MIRLLNRLPQGDRVNKSLVLVACLLTLPVWAAPQEGFESLMQRASEQLAAEDFPTALTTLRAADAVRPGRPEVAYGRAIALSGLNRTDEALEALEGLVAADPGHANGWALLGRTLVNRGDLTSLLRATEAYENAVQLRPADPRLLLALCRTYRTMGMPEAGLAALDAFPGESGRLLQLERARLLIRAGEVETARDLLQQLTAAGGGAQVHYELGTLQENLGDLDAAAAAYRAAVGTGPRFGQAWLAWGELLSRRREFTEALPKLRRATELMPGRAEPYRALGTALTRSGDTAAGIAQLQRAVELAPEHPGTLHQLGTAMAASGDREAARELLAKAAELDSAQRDGAVQTNRVSELGLLTARGLYHYRRADYAESVRLLQNAAQLAPDDALVHYDLGLALAAADGHAAALPALERSLELAPDRGETCAALAIAYRAIGRIDDAAEMERRAEELAQDGANDGDDK
jgi:tetratricopeptide (TPR) repeat protein